VEKKFPVSISEILINGGNPFVRNELNIAVKCNGENKLSGEYLVSSNVFEVQTKDIKEKVSEVDFMGIKLENTKEINFLQVINRKDGISKKTGVHFFAKGNEQVLLEKEVIEDKKVLTVSNGLVSISASPDFAPVVFSMKFKGNEWLDSLFPNPGPKSWWNPWAGGMRFRSNKINLKSLLKEKNTFDFVTKKDQFENEWKGIAIKTEYCEKESIKGRSIIQYFLMQDGSPVIARFYEESNSSGFSVQSRTVCNSFFNTDEGSETYYKTIEPANEEIVVQGAISKMDMDTKLGVFFSPNREEKIFVILPIDKDNQEMCANSELIFSDIFQDMHLEDGETKISKPSFVISSNEDIDHNCLDMLRRIDFEK